MWMIPLPLNQKSVYGREAQANMEETDRERFLWVEAHDSWPSRKEHLETWKGGGGGGGGGPLMWMMPLPLHIDQKSDYDDDI